ncbi:paraquat-inducible membrane protein A [Aliidongia dinghuensis]|uniref:Paraquat-inducible membrane protein A n=1 Tax=Aliidongia dinghuensis TaxID=1867774 RepID=A0A8J3E309_9PROT|nr:paraquat-inducible protein A [Aliidongia dinghuensis]GGF12645.1 paraquat-inducible membrane protein A [Aliidongia dinghuensis]
MTSAQIHSPEATPSLWLDRSATPGAFYAGRLMECHECGLRHDVPALPDGTAARCVRCGALLHRFRAASLDHAFSYTSAGLVLFLMANFLPFMSLDISGRIQSASLVSGIVALYRQGLWALAGVVGLTMFLAPALRLGALFLVLGGLRLRRPPRWLPRLYRWADRLRPWAMVEVYLLGIFVAYVKLVDLATVDVGSGLCSVGALMLAILAAGTALDAETMWREFERRGLVPPVPPVDPHRPACLCHACGLVSNIPADKQGDCRRCGAAVHLRRPDSLNRTWALVMAAILLYIPANLFPVMTITSMGTTASATIMGGVIELADAGMWPLAALVFFASVIVPVLKLVGLIVLLVSTQRRTTQGLRHRTAIYRIVEAIGRWSMIDIFTVSILVALVQLGELATIEPGIGAVSFAAVVIITMIAAMIFDSRLMWDAAGENND